MAISTTPESGVGITLGTRASGGSSFTSIGQVRDDCEFSGWETTVIPLPVLAIKTVAKTSGRTDYGTFSGSAWLVPGDTGFMQLATLFASSAVQDWQVMLTDDTTTPANSSNFTFSGFVSKFTPGNFTGEDAPTADFEIAISGAVTLTPGT